MALNIRNPEAEQLADTLARLTGETKTETVTRALRDRLARLRRERAQLRLADDSSLGGLRAPSFWEECHRCGPTAAPWGCSPGTKTGKEPGRSRALADRVSSGGAVRSSPSPLRRPSSPARSHPR